MRRAAKVDRNQAEIVTFGNKKSEAARRNLLLANAANAARRSFGVWKCAHCETEKPATVHQKRKVYCSKSCMATAYSARLRGSDNPNFRDAGSCVCEECGKSFKSYQKDRRFCSLQCRDRGNIQLRTNAKKDANHDLIVDFLTKSGAFVRDLSRAMFGVPDLLVWHRNAWHLVEVKNPKTYYGRRGLNKAQKDWLDEWQGGPVYIIRTIEDAASFIAGKLEPEKKK